MNRQFFCIIALNVSVLAATARADELPPLVKAEAEKIGFRADVWPIVKRHCWGCHSAQDAKGGLDMGSVAAMLKGGDSGPSLVPGKPEESLLIEMIVGAEPEMPKQQRPLTSAKIHVLRQWIFAGAKNDATSPSTRAEVAAPDVYRFAPAITSVAFNQDGSQVVAACRSEVVIVPTAPEGNPQRIATKSDLLTHVEFSPDGKLLAAAGGAPATFGAVSFFRAADRSEITSRRVASDTLFRGSFSPDGGAIALGGADGAVHVVPVDPKQEVRRFELHSDWVLDAAYSPDGKMIITGGRDKATKICSVETGKLLRSIDSSSESIGSVATDQKFAISAGLARLPISFELSIALSGVAVTGSGNGSRPVSKRNQYAKNFEGQPGPVLDIATSGDRKFVAVVGGYGEARVYNVADRKRVAQITGLPAPVYAVALDATGQRLCVGGKSGELRIYQLPDGKLLKALTPVPVVGAKVTAN